MTDETEQQPEPEKADDFLATGTITITNGMHGNSMPGWRWGATGLSDQEVIGLLVMATTHAIARFVRAVGDNGNHQE